MTNGLDVAVGIKKGIIGMSNPRYAEVWKLLGQLVSYSATGEQLRRLRQPERHHAAAEPAVPAFQGKVGVLWGGSWWIPQLDSAGFTGKYGVFPEPTITSARPRTRSTPHAGVIGGPNGNGQWGVTSQHADSTMTPAKTAS